MKTIFMFGVAAALLNGADAYHIVPAAGSRMELQVEKTGLLRGKKHVFVFERYEGTVLYNAEKVEASTVQMRIAAKSISCKDAWLSAKDLVKVQNYALDEMLASDRHSQIEFASTTIRKTGPGQLQADGTLTIRGVAKPATVNVALEARAGALIMTGSAVVRLPDYGLKPPTAALGAIGTKPDMSFSFSITATPAKNTND